MSRNLLSSASVVMLAAAAVAAVVFFRQPYKQPSPCIFDWQKCRDLEELERRWIRWYAARAQCVREANKLSIHGKPKWPPLAFNAGIPERMSIAAGFAYVYDLDVQFPTEFGTMMVTQLECAYDLTNLQVMSVRPPAIRLQRRP